MARILVVDDEPMVREVVRELLARQGHEVVAASCGEEAITANRRYPYDLAIVDLLMPGKDGIETIAAIRVDAPEASVIVLTGAPPGHWPLEKLYGQPGPMHMLVKPVSEQMLLDMVAEALASHTPAT